MPRKPPNRKKYPTDKPYPDFPLSPRTDGRYAITIHGHGHVFGRRGDWRTALQEYRDVAGAIHGKRIRPATAPLSGLTVKQICNRYLDDRQADVAAGMLALGSWDDYRSALKRFRLHVGGETPAQELGPEHFSKFEVKLKASLGGYAYNRTRALVMAFIRHAVACQWVGPINFGTGFKRIGAGKLREGRKTKLYSAKEVRALLKIAKPQLKAMILLGVNGGFGSTDCACLPKSAVDLKSAFIDFARPKTHIPRQVPLWPRTVRAIRPIVAARPADPIVFRTKHGNAWVRTVQKKNGKIVTKDSVAAVFRKLTDKGSFYVLRHTFRTIADEAKDQHAIARIMGHALPGMAGAYVEAISRERLKAVTGHVHKVLFGQAV